MTVSVDALPLSSGLPAETEHCAHAAAMSTPLGMELVAGIYQDRHLHEADFRVGHQNARMLDESAARIAAGLQGCAVWRSYRRRLQSDVPRSPALAAARFVHCRGRQTAVNGVQPGGPHGALIRLVAHQEHERDLRMQLQ